MSVQQIQSFVDMPMPLRVVMVVGVSTDSEFDPIEEGDGFVDDTIKLTTDLEQPGFDLSGRGRSCIIAASRALIGIERFQAHLARVISQQLSRWEGLTASNSYKRPGWWMMTGKRNELVRVLTCAFVRDFKRLPRFLCATSANPCLCAAIYFRRPSWSCGFRL